MINNSNKSSIITTSKRAQIFDFDSLPIPDRSLVNYDLYAKYPTETAVKNCITIQATRGCPYRCIFCHNIWKKHVYRSAQSIFDEIKLYYDMGVIRFGIVDDIFNFNRANSIRFFNLILKSNMKIQLFFPNGIRGDIIDHEYIDLMVAMGTVYIPMAIETASTRLQALTRKHLNIEKLRSNLDYLCTKYPDTITGLYFMIGFPTETEEEAIATLEFVTSFKWIHFPEFFVVNIYPGTELVNLALKNGITDEEILRNENSAVYQIPETMPFRDKSFVIKLRTRFMITYWLRKERLINVLPGQMKVMTEKEITQFYSGFLQQPFNSISELFDYFKITDKEITSKECFPEEKIIIPNLNKKMKNHFSKIYPKKEQGLKVLLVDVTCYYVNSNIMDALADFLHPPLGLMYLATYLNEKLAGKVHCRIIKSHADFNSHQELLEIIQEFQPTLIGFRCLSFYRDFLHELTTYIKKYFKIPIIVGGAYPTKAYKQVLKDPSINVAVLGEGELTLKEIVECMIENGGAFPSTQKLKGIAGIAFSE